MTVTVTQEGDIARIVINNPPVNATSMSVRSGLLDAVDKVRGCRMALLECVGRTFIAGGDMTEFDKSPVEPHLPDVVNAIENTDTPFVALLHGNVLGGGFEIAMACTYRIAKPGTKFGLPEVHVGLVPGAGGTQRAPRLVGWKMSVEMACLGQVITAEELLEIGAIDEISSDLLATAKSIEVKLPRKISALKVPALDDKELESFKQKISKRSKGQQSPRLNLDALLWAKKPFSEGQPLERELHLKLRQSDESKALRHVFFSERTVTKPSVIAGVNPAEISNVAIIGGGLMGCGIAAACLNGGFRVTLIEQDEEALFRAQDNVKKILDGAVSRGKMTAAQREERLSKFVTGASVQIAEDADLVVEAIFEDLEAKRSLFGQLQDIVSPNTVLATNTSYLSPDEIFADIQYRERCLGIHFFSPAHIMKLVEIVRSGDTAPEVLATAFKFASSLKKTPVLSGICDGFIGNRILMSYRRAAEYLLADGAFPHQIDEAMRNFGMAMGPFEAQDLSGLQIAEANRRRQDKDRNPLERYVPISDRLCAAGRYGQRAGLGWYAYENGKKIDTPDDEVLDIILSYSAENGIKRRTFTKENIQLQLLSAMANEGARIVEENIAEIDAAIDVVKVAGYGFPRWHGGPMHYAKLVGYQTISSTLDELENASPNSWVRAHRFS